MGRLIYSVITSLDGYVADKEGNFDWAAPDEEVHSFVNDLERPIGTYLYGRRMYETMRYWDNLDNVAGEPDVVKEFASIWRAANKVVYSRSLEAASSAKTRLERDFNAEQVRSLKRHSVSDVSIGGPELAAEAIRAGLIDEFRLLVTPIIVGGGRPSFPDDLKVKLELIDERRFRGGVVHLHYRASG